MFDVRMAKFSLSYLPFSKFQAICPISNQLIDRNWSFLMNSFLSSPLNYSRKFIGQSFWGGRVVLVCVNGEPSEVSASLSHRLGLMEIRLSLNFQACKGRTVEIDA